MKKKLFIIIFFLSISSVQSIETKIIHNIQNEIITNVDIKNEFKYLVALNNDLKKLDKEKILNISNQSIVRETIKKIEVLKNFKDLTISEEHLNLLLKNIYSRLDLKSLNEFELYLKGYELTLDDIKKKISINALWSQIIIKKYSNQIIINEEQIKKKIIKNAKIQLKEYQLSEIIFEIENKEEIKKKYEKIVKSVNEIGFKNTASLYSISETAKVGGDIGWINENSLNNKIKRSFTNLEINEISKPIILSNGILILKVMNIKKSETQLDYKTELKKAINYEQNRQINQFSKIYFNKIKKNIEFNE
jgi:peptidyl-prolyl cis-trans isomerase SurA|tara:strand:+ start:1475 stop:2392 length:918 start_codon:yes stop_codon:yes gene_type:complete